MRAILTFAVLSFAAGVGPAAEPTEAISVTGSATVFARPTMARIHYTVRVSEDTAEAAKEAAAKRAATVTGTLKELKLDNLATTAGAVSYSRRLSQPGIRGGGFRGGAVNPGANPAPPPGPQTTFYGSMPLTTTVREADPEKLLASVDSLMRKLLESGIDLTGDGFDPDEPFGRGRVSTSSPRVEWLLADDAAPRQEAYRAAVRKAKVNATAVAKELGWEAVKVVSVKDSAAASAEVSGPAPRTPAGEVAVTARVTLTYSR